MDRTTCTVCVTEQHTMAAGEALAARLRDRLAARRGAVIALHGDLGAGKTTFAKGVARGLGIHEAVTSPTYQLVLEYEAPGDAPRPLTLYHIDLYRIDAAAQLASLALDDFIHGSGVTLVEWPERAGDTLPDDTIHVRIDIEDDMRRRIEITESGPPP
ncbi:MAG: tRNA (adenosine(37)-N6)-threonylcarbamoyltransferase complex ATPase subunit type 1 TsaE [Spirochaetaceae bacterium]|nr:tRNA (adenosine(37)-N6)-threonylcarbamoyltransferase complex ATPase subunit type 1 TsaE [Spirochaetaceae bacterium]